MNKTTYVQRKKRIGGFLLIPTFLLMTAAVLFPLIFAFLLSLFNYTFLNPYLNSFVGLGNYIRVFHDPYFWNSLKITVFFVLMVVPLEFLLGYSTALVLSQNSIKFKSIFYFILTMPMVMSPVAVGLIWRMLLHPDLGIVNYLLNKIGIGSVNWFGSSKMALVTIVLVDVWQQISFMILLLMAGLTALPVSPFESATLDGANAFQKLIYIKTPLLMPIIIITILQRIITSFKTYDLVYILTSGGPGISTDLISYNIYRTTFMGLDLSVASAVSYILLMVVLFITVILFRSVQGDNK